MGISSTGIGSGLDVESIVTKLMTVEQKPLTAVTTQKTDYQSKVSAYGTLKSSLSTFQTAINALSTPSKFNAQTVTSGNTSVFTATANGSAALGDYSVTVSQLAKSQKLATVGFANTTDTVSTGTLTIDFGTYTADPLATPPATHTFTAGTKSTVNITIDSSNNTLVGVRDAINAANASVSATIINNGTNNQLVLTSKDTGEVNNMRISGIPELAYDLSTGVSNMSQTQVAKNALLNVDGIDVVKSSNSITDVISGVTLNLLATNASSINLDVASNQDTVKASVTAFVDAYNKLDTTLRSLTKYDSTGKSSGALLGDATARTVINQIKSVMTKTINSGGAITSLTQIGVGFQRDGQLALDSTKLTAALTSNFNDIATLFTKSGKATDPQITYSGSTSKTQAGTYGIIVSQLGTSLVNAAGTINSVVATGSGTNLIGATGDASEGLNIKVAGGALGARGTINFTIGYAAQLDTLVTSLLSSDGMIASRTDGIASSITRLDKQADAINLRLTAIEARYRAQFTSLDTLLSSMSTTSSFLTQQLAAINANK
ncbi:MAG: flagellar filament capping protein FliD [Pseudomonadota bacterium]